MKILFFLLLMIPSVSAFSQFQLTPDGLRSDFDINVDYTTIIIPKTTGERLYKAVYKYIEKAEFEILQKSKDRAITYKVEDVNFLSMSKRERNRVVYANYEVALRFFDNKIEYRIGVLDMPTKDSKYDLLIKGNLKDGYPIYNNNLKLIRSYEKSEIERYFNDNIRFFRKDIITILNTLPIEQTKAAPTNNQKVVIDKDGLATIKAE